MTEERVLMEEIKLITAIGRKDLGRGSLVNLTDGGETTIGIVPWNKGKKCAPWSVELREKMRSRVPWNKGKRGVQIITEQMRQKCRDRIPWNKGLTDQPLHTDEHKEKIRKSMIRARQQNNWSTKPHV